MNLIYSLFNQPAILIGILTLIGLVALKKSTSEILSGTFKTIIGMLILSAGGGVVADVLMEYFIPLFEGAFSIQGVIPSNEAIIGVAELKYGTEMVLIMGLGFVLNLIFARLSKFKYIYLTGHMALFMSGLLAAVLSTLGFKGIELVILGSLLNGAMMIISPAVLQPLTRKVLGSDDFAIGHYNSSNILISGLASKVFGDKKKTTEDIKVSDKVSFFRDTSVSIALVMSILFIITCLFSDKNTALELSGGDNIYIYSVIQALQFTGGFLIVLQGVRMMLGELVPAFKGISEKIVPDAIPALDIPVVYPYAPNAVLIGFLTTTIGSVIMIFILPLLGLPVVLLGDSVFFVGATVGVLCNEIGGLRGTIIGGLVNGALLSLLPSLMLPVMSSLGFVGSTFADGDYAVLGIILGRLNDMFGKYGIYALVIILILSIFIPSFINSGQKENK